jgi:hypothetical protein
MQGCHRCYGQVQADVPRLLFDKSGGVPDHGPHHQELMARLVCGELVMSVAKRLLGLIAQLSRDLTGYVPVLLIRAHFS